MNKHNELNVVFNTYLKAPCKFAQTTMKKREIIKLSSISSCPGCHFVWCVSQ